MSSAMPVPILPMGSSPMVEKMYTLSGWAVNLKYRDWIINTAAITARLRSRGKDVVFIIENIRKGATAMLDLCEHEFKKHTMKHTTSAVEAKDICEKQASAFFPNAVNLQFESVEMDESGKYWLVTFRFEVNPDTPSELLTNKKTTVYKVFWVELKSGQLLAVRNREMN